MALPSTTVWEVETGGNDSNGGGFDSALVGTDYSLQGGYRVYIDNASIAATLAASTITFTTLSITGSTAQNPAKFTVAAAPPLGTPVTISGYTGNWAACNGNFTATYVDSTHFTIPVDSSAFGAAAGTPVYQYNAQATDRGNIVNILTGGAGLTVGRYSIASVVAGTSWTTNATTGAASAAMTGYMGGALLTPGVAASLFANYHTLYIKPGTYPITSATPNIAGGTISISASRGAVIGYSTNRTAFNTDTKPYLVLSAGVSSATIINNSNIPIFNLSLDGANQTTSKGIVGWGISCLFANFTSLACGQALGCEFTGCSGVCASGAYYSVFHGNSLTCSNGTVICCIAYGNTSTPFVGNIGAVHLNSVSYNNSGASTDGFQAASSQCPILTINCIAEGNTRYGFNNANTNNPGNILINCSAYGNGTPTNGFVAGSAIGLLTPLSSVFVSAATQDFRLSPTTGAALISAGYPTTWPATAAAMLNYLDIGAAQILYTPIVINQTINRFIVPEGEEPNAT